VKDMSQRDGFASGFLVGAVFGSVVGGVLGALIVSRRDADLLAEEETDLNHNQPETQKISGKRRQVRAAESSALEMETARRSLEDKIAQLNATIDDVRKQLGNVNGTASESVNERPLTKDP
jgi:predicted RNase H-like nuclease (RuvC/YqgF family)